MTHAQRFATEWLWFVGCVLASLVIAFVVQYGDPEEILIPVLFFGILGGVPAYLVMGAVRLTVWSLTQQKS